MVSMAPRSLRTALETLATAFSMSWASTACTLMSTPVTVTMAWHSGCTPNRSLKVWAHLFWTMRCTVSSSGLAAEATTDATLACTPSSWLASAAKATCSIPGLSALGCTSSQPASPPSASAPGPDPLAGALAPALQLPSAESSGPSAGKFKRPQAAAPGRRPGPRPRPGSLPGTTARGDSAGSKGSTAACGCSRGPAPTVAGHGPAEGPRRSLAACHNESPKSASSAQAAQVLGARACLRPVTCMVLARPGPSTPRTVGAPARELAPGSRELC
mmetsp:Transcript_98077/g.304972  ORF Transcript_98077/g.304972 Transcript_98077/m.304972 type:complete len:273 (-) Transcript_98077:24-842(-)